MCKFVLRIFCILFSGFILSMTCVSATELGSTLETVHDDNIDTYVPCGVKSSEQLLKSLNVDYNYSQLKNCICEDSDCNASMFQIRECLENKGLLTYAYTVNNNMLQQEISYTPHSTIKDTMNIT